ncbi:hypothetical protein DFH09DRAFT_1082869 [Mycena vulgaris]|nr:hypothetical protein DFH09DRAFT_1082869 [Mycena vulgaris]
MSELSEPSELKPSEPDSSSVNEQAWIEDPMSLEDMNTDSKISIIHDKKRARFPIRLYKNGTGIAAQVHDCYPGEDDVKKKKVESREQKKGLQIPRLEPIRGHPESGHKASLPKHQQMHGL